MMTTILAIWLIGDCMTLLLFRRECVKMMGERPEDRNFAASAEKLFSSPLHIAVALTLGFVTWPVVLLRLLKDMVLGR